MNTEDHAKYVSHIRTVIMDEVKVAIAHPSVQTLYALGTKFSNLAHENKRDNQLARAYATGAKAVSNLSNLLLTDNQYLELTALAIKDAPPEMQMVAMMKLISSDMPEEDFDKVMTMAGFAE